MTFSTPWEVYLYGQYGGLAMLVPYSAIALLVVGTALAVVLIKFRTTVKVWFDTLPAAVRWAVLVGLILELGPSFAVVLGIGCLFGIGYAEVLTGGNPGIGILLGLPWGCTSSFLAIEAAAALLAGSAVAGARWGIRRLQAS